jgi:dienelactone hydrolase
MVVFGGQDHIASPETRRRLWESFTTNGQACEWHDYSYGRHGFASPDSEGYQPELAALAWPLTLSFLHRTLVEPAPAA